MPQSLLAISWWGTAVAAGEVVAPYAGAAVATVQTTAVAHPTVAAMVEGVAETAVECSMTGGGCGVADYAVGAITAGVAHRLSQPSRGYHNETVSSSPVKPESAIDQWEEFLGAGPYTNIHPRTGSPDPDRLVSSDGARSIRYGSHEMNSSPTKHHYHEEIWTYDPIRHVTNVDNTIVRVPHQ